MPLDEVDITQDLTGGADDAALGDVTVPAMGQGNIPQGADGAEQTLPDGVVKAHEATKETKPENSLRDQLSSAFKGEAPAADDAPTAKVEVPALTKDTEGKYRQADGTFASKEQIDTFEAAQAASKPNAEAQQAPTYLRSMTPLEQQQYNALPAEIQQFVGRTMEAVEGQASRFNEYGLLEQELIGPRRDAWAQNGLTPAVALNQLFSLSDFATRAPKDFVLWFADQHKIDLDAALDERDQQLTANPELRAVQAQVQQLQQQLHQSTNGHVQAQQEASLREVEMFAAEQDGAGKLLRPYLTDVMTTWPAHIQALRATSPTMPNAELLQKAYEAACWAVPNVRAKMQEADNQQRLLDAKKRADAARLAGSSVNGSPNGGVLSAAQTNDNLSIRQSLQAAFNEHRA